MNLNMFKERRSIREYLSKEVSNDILLHVLEAGRWAPSAHNAQPWRFIVIRSLVMKLKLARAMASRWNRDMTRNGVPKERREGLIEDSVRRIGGAPVVIVVCLSMKDMDFYSDDRRNEIEYIMAVQSVAAAVENVLLATYDEGLGSCWLCAPLFCKDVVRKILKISGHIDPQALITLGYPAEKPNPPSRKPLEEVVYQDLLEA